MGLFAREGERVRADLSAVLVGLGGARGGVLAVFTRKNRAIRAGSG